MAHTAVRNSDFLVDKPIPWNVYDTGGSLLFAKGAQLDEDTKGKLLKRGALRDITHEVSHLGHNLHKGHGHKEEDQSDKKQGVKIAFNESAVKPGDLIHIDRNSDKSHVMANLVGYLKGKFIIITVPSDEQGALFMKEGETLTVKVFSGKHVLVFTTTVMAVSLKPHPHIYISYPPTVTGFIVRKSERIASRIVVAVDTENKEQLSGLITDISTGGGSFVTRNANVKLHSEIMLNFKLVVAEATFILRIKGIIRSVRDNQSDVLTGATGYGVQFQDLAPEDLLVLGIFVQQKIAESRQG